MDREGLRAHPDHDWQQAVVQALCSSPVMGDRTARSMLAELIGDALGRPVVLREHSTMHVQLLELVRFCARAGNAGLIALAESVSLLEGHSRTAGTVGELIRERVGRTVPTLAAPPALSTPPHPPPLGDRPSPVRVSCSSADIPWTTWIVRQLEDAGLGVLMQEEDLLPDDGTRAGVASRPEPGERVIAVLSPAYVGAAPVRRAWDAAYRKDPGAVALRLVPVMVKPCRPPWPLSAVARTDLTGLGEDQARTRLLGSLGIRATGRTTRTGHTTPPHFPGPAGRP
ncbi:toll/interleukin-1 receptor domain-containing protein [Streptomyces sp. NPDC047990]|uniref:toll/interleukin-1 receptor domain-containing protein n=1 Tax=Streptomyces sp. NPDC047990 TaxID=3365496 RepID=UPI003723C588